MLLVYHIAFICRIEDGGSKLLQYVGTCLSDYTTWHPTML